MTISTSANCVFALAFSPDGKRLATGTNDRHGFIKIWDTATGALVKTLEGHADAVLSLAYSHDGKRLLSSSYDRTAILWDLESGTARTFKGHEGWVFSADFAPPAKEGEAETRIVTASQDGTVMVWSIATQKPEPPFQGHTGPVYTARFSPDGRFIASAGYDKRILLWKPEDVKPFDYGIYLSDHDPPPPVFESLEGHTAGVSCLEFSPNGKLLASGGHDNTVCVWNVEKRKLLKTLRGHAGRVRSLAFAPQLPDVEAQLLSGSYDESAKVWNLMNYEEFQIFAAPVFAGQKDAILGAAFSPDNKSFVSASRDRTAMIWNLSSGTSESFQQGHDYLTTAAVFFRSGRKFLTAAADDTARVWDVETGMNIRNFPRDRQQRRRRALRRRDQDPHRRQGPRGRELCRATLGYRVGQAAALLPHAQSGDYGGRDLARRAALSSPATPRGAARSGMSTARSAGRTGPVISAM